ncbi:hypothetical protein BH11PAT1_BH11PAT1_0930 [soil metagenome]
MFFLSDDAWEVRDVPGKGRGIFTKQEIAPGTVIGDYIGRLLRPCDIDEERDGLYEMYFSTRASLFPDTSKPGVHLLNHSHEPNCWLYTYYGHTLFFSLRKIFPGEELTISYLLGLKSDCNDDCDHDCHCGSIICTGTMHLRKEKYEKWWKFEEKNAKKTKRVKIKIGEMLPVLDTYPKFIPDENVYDLFGYAGQPAIPYEYEELPSVKELRKRIREIGRALKFEKIGKTVLGINNGSVVFK